MFLSFCIFDGLSQMSDNKENTAESPQVALRSNSAECVEQSVTLRRSVSPRECSPPTLHTANRHQTSASGRFNRDVVWEERRKLHTQKHGHAKELNTSVGMNLERLLLLTKLSNPQYEIPVKKMLSEVTEDETKVFTIVPTSLTPRRFVGKAKMTSATSRVASGCKNEDYEQFLSSRPKSRESAPIVNREKPLRPSTAKLTLVKPAASRFMDPTLYDVKENTRRAEVEAAKAKRNSANVKEAPRKTEFVPKIEVMKVKDAAFVPSCATRVPDQKQHLEMELRKQISNRKTDRGFKF